MSDKIKEGGLDKRSVYGFDPSGLERAAEALKYLDSSPNVSKAFEVAMKKEELRILEEQNTIKYWFLIVDRMKFFWLNFKTKKKGKHYK